MSVDHVKSTPITNLDAVPVVQNTAGEGGPAPLKTATATAVGVASSSINATYQFVRVPSNAKIKEIMFESATQAVGAGDIGLYYATDGVGGKPTSLLAANAIDQDFFASAISLAPAAYGTVMNESGTYTVDKRNQPLWQAVGLSSDPGGNFDIVLTLTTAITTGTGLMGMTVSYTD
jgi:hypothetical protein